MIRRVLHCHIHPEQVQAVMDAITDHVNQITGEEPGITYSAYKFDDGSELMNLMVFPDQETEERYLGSPLLSDLMAVIEGASAQPPHFARVLRYATNHPESGAQQG